jgi:crossover junction endodeoxyribonuclease RusA
MTTQTPDSAAPFHCNVIGQPAPQGSKRHVGNGRMVEANAGLPDWRTTVALQVRSAMNHQQRTGYAMHVPVAITLAFRLPRPVSLPKRVTRHSREPDLDKLIRAVFDSLANAGLLRNDGQVCAVRALKRYARDDEPTGCRVIVTELDQT